MLEGKDEALLQQKAQELAALVEERLNTKNALVAFYAFNSQEDASFFSSA